MKKISFRNLEEIKLPQLDPYSTIALTVTIEFFLCLIFYLISKGQTEKTISAMGEKISTHLNLDLTSLFEKTVDIIAKDGMETRKTIVESHRVIKEEIGEIERKGKRS